MLKSSDFFRGWIEEFMQKYAISSIPIAYKYSDIYLINLKRIYILQALNFFFADHTFIIRIINGRS